MSAPVAASARLKRLRMRCWRRGTREMDLILGPYADAVLAGRERPPLEALESLLEENDQSLYAWVSGAEPAPGRHAAMIGRLRAFRGV